MPVCTAQRLPFRSESEGIIPSPATGAATEAAATSYDVIYSASNPIPDIADRTRPAIVQITTKQEVLNADSIINDFDSRPAFGIYKDENTGKVTYASLLGISKAKSEAGRMTQEACDAVRKTFGESGDFLISFAMSLLNRIK